MGEVAIDTLSLGDLGESAALGGAIQPMREPPCPHPGHSATDGTGDHDREEESKMQELPPAPSPLTPSLSQMPPPPLAPSFLNKMDEAQRDKRCAAIAVRYREAIEDCDEDQLCGMENLHTAHHYKSTASESAAAPSGEMMKAITMEIKKSLPRDLELSPAASMFLRYDEDRPQFLRACLTGVSGTPYDSGCFIFDIQIPDSYPGTNCNVTHTTKNASMVTANNGPGGFSPNLHKDSGKVCLSLLGTWDGPGWEAGKSNVYQVLSSILWMILGAEHPYYMEPSFGGWEGTAPSSNHAPKVTEYDEEVYFGTAKWAILETLKDPPRGFEEVIQAHFRVKRHIVLENVKAWMDNGSDGLKTKLEPVLEELRAELDKILTAEEIEEDIVRAKEEVSFIETKMKYLQQKLNACEVAGKCPKTTVPMAYKRFVMGPSLLKSSQEKLAALESKLIALKQKSASESCASEESGAST